MERKIVKVKIQETELEPETIKCQNCGREHRKSTMNCCWTSCKCGKEICANCGSNNLGDMIEDGLTEEDDETSYWCCKYCKDCGQEGCAMCI